jgi:hypothetical protein
MVSLGGLISSRGIAKRRCACYHLFFSRKQLAFGKDQIMGARRIRREQRQVDMAESRHRNGFRKTKERARRLARLQDALKKTQPPYAPTILSWLSDLLDKPGRLITPDDVKQFLAKK